MCISFKCTDVSRKAPNFALCWIFGSVILDFCRVLPHKRDQPTSVKSEAGEFSQFWLCYAKLRIVKKDLSGCLTCAVGIIKMFLTRQVLSHKSKQWLSSSEICDHKPSIFSYLKYENVCGRPLGLRFYKKTGELYIADSYFGLLKVGPEGGLAKPLATGAESVPFNFTNDLDVDEEGNVYFTDSSTNYQRKNFLQLLFTSEPTGRLLKYDPISEETTVLVRNLQFPNGVSLSKDGSFVVFCEGSLGRLSRYWLKGDKAGMVEVFAILPGFPDNVRTNENGEFWVAIHSRRHMYGHFLAHHTRVRKFLMKLPIPAKYHYLLNVGGRLHAMVIKYSPEGKLLQVLEDSKGKVVKVVSEVREKDGKLWLGSVLMSFIAVYDLNLGA